MISALPFTQDYFKNGVKAEKWRWFKLTSSICIYIFYVASLAIHIFYELTPVNIFMDIFG